TVPRFCTTGSASILVKSRDCAATASSDTCPSTKALAPSGEGLRFFQERFMRLRLFENYRFVLYAPFYAAHAIGAYTAEGLAVESLTSSGAGLAEQALLDGAVDVLWAGPMRVMKHHDENSGSALVCFAEVVCRDPFSIVGRYPNPGFQLTDLAQMRVATVSEV